MSFRFIKRGEDSLTRRTFACDDCEIEWSQWLTREDPLPECPVCKEREARSAVTSPALLTNKSKAVDIAQDMMEEMGYTDFNDNQRKGDTAVKTPAPMGTAEREALMQVSAEMQREMEIALPSAAPQRDAKGQPIEGAQSQASMADGFWQHTPHASAPSPQVQQALTGAAVLGARQARAEGADPMALLHAKKPPLKLNVVADDRPRK